MSYTLEPHLAMENSKELITLAHTSGSVYYPVRLLIGSSAHTFLKLILLYRLFQMHVALCTYSLM